MAKPVAIKYCGGCDPVYDRVVVFESICNAAGETIEWTRFDPSISDSVLIVCGCTTACPEHEMDLSRTKIAVVLSEEPADPQNVVLALLGNGDEND